MSDQLAMFSQEISPDTPNAISSPASASGATLFDPQESETTNPSGREVVRASRSARRGSARARRTNAICGRLGFDSSPSEDLSESLASRLAPVTDSLGSTMFDLIWKKRVTPAGRLIYAVRASGVHTSDSASISQQSHWPTPAANEYEQRDQDALMERRARCKEENGNGNGFGLTLGNAAHLASWLTPQQKDFRSGQAERYLKGEHAVSINDQAQLASWMTPTEDDASGWPRDLEKRIGHQSHQVNLKDQVGLARLTDSGGPPTGCTAATKSTGQLNPALSRWLMGLPAIFDICAVASQVRKNGKK